MGLLIEFLKDTDLFYNLNPTQLELIENICEECKYKQGDVIFEENSRQGELYLILSGEVEILINPSLVSAKMETPVALERIAMLRRGQSFGEMALVDEGVRSATAKVVSKNAVLLRLSRHRFLLLCSTYPELGYRVMYNLAMDMAQKIRNTDLQLRETLLYQRPAKAERK
jgi:CRP/FNR family transcriptional regulator, cyclic AMP receptor protein